jgi:T-complex protein 1 subunit eta
LFCAGRVQESDLKRVAKATGGVVQTSTSQVFKDPSVLGTCGIFEERQVGDERFNVFTDCPARKTRNTPLWRPSKRPWLF